MINFKILKTKQKSRIFQVNEDVKKILDLSLKYNLGHIPSALSSLNILKGLKQFIDRDDVVFISGKSYGVQAHCVAWDLDYIENTSFASNEYKHIEFYDQTLGNALGYAIGRAMVDESKIYVVLISDATYFMGKTREQLHIIYKFNLPIMILVDSNGQQLFGSDEAHMIDVPQNFAKNSLFTFCSCVTENDLKSFIFTLNNYFTYDSRRSFLIFCKTKKGNGVRLFEDFSKDYHYSPMNDELYEKVIIYENSYR